MHVLLVEDDNLIAEGIKTGLEISGFTVDRVDTISQARSAISTLRTDIIILDLALPDGDGMTLLSELRGQHLQTPLLILTARDSVSDRVAGLGAGADDYLLKPFDLDELIARLYALLRRSAGQSTPVLRHGSLELDPQRREVYLHGHPVALSRREFELLRTFIHSRGSILTAEQLKDSLYGFGEQLESNALNVHLYHLRRKISPRIIETVRGVGYRLGPASALSKTGPEHS